MREKFYGIIGIGMYFWLVIASTAFLAELILADVLKLTTISNLVIFWIVEVFKYSLFIILLIWGLNKLEYLITNQPDLLRRTLINVFWIFVIVQTLQFIYAPIYSKIFLINRDPFESYSVEITQNYSLKLVREGLGISRYLVTLLIILPKLR